MKKKKKKKKMNQNKSASSVSSIDAHIAEVRHRVATMSDEELTQMLKRYEQRMQMLEDENNIRRRWKEENSHHCLEKKKENDGSKYDDRMVGEVQYDD